MKALILAPFDPVALERLREKVEIVYESWMDTRRLFSPEELIDRIENDDIQIVIVEADFIFDEVFDSTDKLRFIGICRSAVNNVDIEAATEHGVLVVHTPARNAVSVAELTIGLILSLARHIPAVHSMVKSGQWLDPVDPYMRLRGVELANKKAGIVGFGAIGSEVGKRLRAFDMNVLVYDPLVNSEKIVEIGARQVDLGQLMKESDFITLHCPVSADTSGLIGGNEISMMKPTSCLINTAGWDIVDNEALLHDLEQGRIAGAAFDTFETHPVSSGSPFLSLDNVVLTPHIGGATDGTVKRYSQMMVDGIEKFINGKQPENLVNPEAWKINGQ